MSANFRLTIDGPAPVELGPGYAKWEFIEETRKLLLDTPRGQAIMASMERFADEAGDPSVPLHNTVSEYFCAHFPDFLQTDLPPGVYARTQEWMGKSLDEKKTKRMTTQLSAAIFDTWNDSVASLRDPHILGAILKITVLHEMVHVIRRVFCTTLTPEKLRGLHTSTSVPLLDAAGQMIQVQSESGWEWEHEVLGELQVAFEAGAAGNWTKVLAVGFMKNHKTQWVHKTETNLIESILNLQLFALKRQFRYDTDAADAPPFPGVGVVWRHCGARLRTADFSPTISPSPSRGPGQILSFPYTRLPEAEAKQLLEDAAGVKVDIQLRVCGTGQSGYYT
ncbi:hypothetical protein GGX14DRAFT_613398 [Mycena pura]|uniref:Uncharacterized protein n=1 Tax=Mycena pura TaxID=153505 RepID=A0AAD6YSS4_9AGAR|nr:hypothetical protein GGX14DRAFT_613398 [Mycena pura]